MTGTFQRKSNGKNLFIPEDGGEPVFVAERNSAHAMNNDKVKIILCAKRRRHEIEGQVIEFSSMPIPIRRNSESQQKLCIPSYRKQYTCQ